MRFRRRLDAGFGYAWQLNPVRGKRPLVRHPRDWPWSSYPGYAREKARYDWIAYEPLWHAWAGEQGGTDPRRAYRRFVEAGLSDPPTNPLQDAWEGWLLGSEAFLKKIKKTVSEPAQADEVPAARRLSSLEPDHVIEAVAAHHGVPAGPYRQPRSTAPGSDLAAYLAHRRTTATLRQLAEPFGLRDPDSVSNLIRRTKRPSPHCPS